MAVRERMEREASRPRQCSTASRSNRQEKGRQRQPILRRRQTCGGPQGLRPPACLPGFAELVVPPAKGERLLSVRMNEPARAAGSNYQGQCVLTE